MAPPGELRQAADSSLPPSAAVEPHRVEEPGRLAIALDEAAAAAAAEDADETWGDWEAPDEAPTGADQ